MYLVKIAIRCANVLLSRVASKRIVFYSWQSDLDGKTTRSFIEEALKKAVKVLQKDDTLDVGLVIDRDTKDVPGSPDIAKYNTKLNRVGIKPQPPWKGEHHTWP